MGFPWEIDAGLRGSDSHRRCMGFTNGLGEAPERAVCRNVNPSCLPSGWNGQAESRIPKRRRVKQPVACRGSHRGTGEVVAFEAAVEGPYFSPLDTLREGLLPPFGLFPPPGFFPPSSGLPPR